MTIAVDHPKIMIPVAASNDAKILQPGSAVMSPYPRVVKVTMEKYNASSKVSIAPTVL